MRRGGCSVAGGDACPCGTRSSSDTTGRGVGSVGSFPDQASRRRPNTSYICFILKPFRAETRAGCRDVPHSLKVQQQGRLTFGAFSSGKVRAVFPARKELH